MASAEQSFFATPFAGAGGRIIASPFQFVGDADTFLRVTSVCSVSGVTLALQGRRVDEQGALQALQEFHAPFSTRTRKTQDYKLGAGSLLNLTVFATAGSPLAGQCYVMVQLLRNFGGTAIILGTLLGGYVTATQALGFPGSPIASSVEGEPCLRAIVGTTPAVGASIFEAVPAGARWEPLSWRFDFTTSPVVADRKPVLVFNIGGNNIGQVVNFSTIPASNFAHFTFMPLIESTSDPIRNVYQAAWGSRMILLAGSTLQQTAYNLDVNDQFGQPFYLVREWLEVD